MANLKVLKILLVDDHASYRELLFERLRGEIDLDVVGMAKDGDEALALAKGEQPDLIVFDVDMPGLNCFDAARRIRSHLSDVRLMFLSAFAYDHYIEQALSVGALAYLTKSESADRIVDAIRNAAQDRSTFSPEVRERIILDAKGAHLLETSKASVLTQREKEVLGYIARGLSKKEIASVMKVGVKTVEKHAENLMSKLGIHDRVELALYAVREGLANL
jgi:DNA-binding NarL/FixJ family response regulator